MITWLLVARAGSVVVTTVSSAAIGLIELLCH